MRDLSPVVLFVYNRIDHTIKTIESLKNNTLASETVLYIISDGCRGSEDRKEVAFVRDYISRVDGFKKVKVLYRKKNYGLARNIISGVTNIINKYGKVIVLEDDIITSPYFLDFMNKALEKYQNERRVMSISGYVSLFDKDDLPDSFFLPWFDCWGWATWSDRWDKFSRKPEELILSTGYKERKFINVNGSSVGLWNQVIDNYRNIRRTWAIFFHVVICRYNGLVLYPKESYCCNIGFDGSGDNCVVSNDYETTLCSREINNLSDKIEACDKAIISFENFNRNISGNKFKRIITILWQVGFRFIVVIHKLCQKEKYV